ncbi:exosome complex component CSL4 [Exaiptasia diaphana]|uniref:Exosome complex component CSL4 n=1 Tax=Exaiptasia diaphana TaxID=2652724 RepID=A0A913WXH2_EXADI|nr:exosome complex component CSL4 [Exaiptasia diaphana]KXJ17143.1 Exosome complex component CSL4 [Exaiptasia diaphana]
MALDGDVTIVVPGERLGSLEQFAAGNGTYSRHGYVYSSLAGLKHVVQGQEKQTISVMREEQESVVPGVGSVVTCKVTSVNPRFCKVSILGVDSTALKEPFRGIIRKEDVRATEKDRVEIYKCFRPGDIVVAKVMSLGDALSYQLSTADNSLGVVFAKSEAGATMVPISWCEMQCPKTMAKESRKVAKVQSQ